MLPKVQQHNEIYVLLTIKIKVKVRSPAIALLT